ncbi:MFS transporter [Thalassospira sp. HF15]|uniref:MFS transporter n=1 Tax=Thalassospira sp. HF15 TaxID=2722755 RepID=UPI0014306484|nr:MFS transporter [Thalassospira sp. HF15]NIY74187.1 MFS transporter [Thalassospira sp. HF15]
MSTAFRIGATGFGLIAVCYGFARFAFGLFLPVIDQQLSMGPTISGFISGGSFLGYCIAIIASAALTEQFGPRRVAIGASLVAALGMIGIATAPNATWLACAVLVAGSSTGLASPPMAAAVACAVQAHQKNKTNATINAGTSAGVALSGPIALLITGEWRMAFAGFAVTAIIMAIISAITLPSSQNATATRHRLPQFNGNIRRLMIAAFLMGAASTALWSFGGKLATLRLGWQSDEVGILWIAIGSAGIAGAFAGNLVARFGVSLTHWFFLGLLSVGMLAVGFEGASALTTFLGGALFGGAYVILTGVYLIWGVNALPRRPATGLMIGFLMIAVGQTVGAPVFGILIDTLGPEYAVLSFAILSILAGLTHTGQKAALA